MVDGAKFNSHDSGSHLKKEVDLKKWLVKEKFVYDCNWVEVARKISQYIGVHF